MKTALTIAGSDPSGGAGIQADIKTMTTNGVYAMSVITALTVQNTTGVKEIQLVDPDFLQKQIDCIFTDIVPDAVKIGMLGSADLSEMTAERLKYYNAKNIVVDPVMISTSGTSLLEQSAIETLEHELFSQATLITPNIPEIEKLTGMTIIQDEDRKEAVKKLYQKYGCAVLCKGGHATGHADDLLYDGKQFEWFYADRIENPNTHGTGCTLSSAIASNLAKGYSLSESVSYAKKYITGALQAMLKLGKGNGPLNHAFSIVGK